MSGCPSARARAQDKAPEVTTLYDFFVYGTPRPKGSMRPFVRNDRVVVTSDNKSLKGWQHNVGSVAVIHRNRNRFGLITGPVELVLTFQLARPKRHRDSVYHVVKPDLDKLTRAICDALTGTIYEDDNHVTRITASKDYVENIFPSYPGVRIQVLSVLS